MSIRGEFRSFYKAKTTHARIWTAGWADASMGKSHFGGAVAQLGARLDGIEEVVGSNPIGSTKFHPAVFQTPNS